jgi:hypothetical protein
MLIRSSNAKARYGDERKSRNRVFGRDRCIRVRKLRGANPTSRTSTPDCIYRSEPSWLPPAPGDSNHVTDDVSVGRRRIDPGEVHAGRR